MDTQEVIKRLRQPAKKTNANATAGPNNQQGVAQEQAQKKHTFQNMLLGGTLLAVVIVGLIALFPVMEAKNRAENVSEELDPNQIDGLTVQQTFNPNQNVTYVQISEGVDRNVTVSNLGTTLPIISRFNFKALTPENFEVIGSAPWALTTNFSANIDDAEILQYLLANDTMIHAFLLRSDVAPLVENPQELAALIKDKNAMKEFFEDDTTKQVLARPALIQMLSKSRFMSFLLISETAKYFRTHPDEAADLIASSSYLRALQANPDVAQAVRENRYLAKIADKLLTPKAGVVPDDQQEPVQEPKKANTKKTKKKKS